MMCWARRCFCFAAFSTDFTPSARFFATPSPVIIRSPSSNWASASPRSAQVFNSSASTCWAINNGPPVKIVRTDKTAVKSVKRLGIMQEVTFGDEALNHQNEQEFQIRPKSAPLTRSTAGLTMPAYRP